MIGLDESTARRLISKYLVSLSSRPDTPFEMKDLENEVGRWYSEEQGGRNTPPNADWTIQLGPNGITRVHEAIWDLIVQRVLTLSRFNDQWHPQAQNWKYLRLTEYGAEVVREQRWSPYDPDGYLKELKGQSPRVFSLCQLYVAEALTCFRGGAYIATSVMLGAASEGAMLDLFERLVGAMKANGRMPEVDDYERKLSKEQSFYKKYELFNRRFSEVRPKVPGRLTDDLDGQMIGVFHLIRQYRNEAGHPTGTAVERLDAFRNMTLFISYCKRIESLGDWLEGNPEKLT